MSDSSERWQRLMRHFDILSELPIEERAQAVARLAWEESDVADELERMLYADAAGEGLLDGHALSEAEPEPPLPPAPVPDRSGERLGGFELLERLGSGGMGEVYRARRSSGDFHQEVAIKVLRGGLGPDFTARFARERQIQARLTHPLIARLIDAGVDGDTPWLAMELIRGEHAVAFAKAHALPIAARLKLVEDVAGAVDYAHRQLIVHRDIKPSNVLVDESGTPHLLDFGIAKLLEPGDATELTASDMRVMSPMYAAPEQFRGEPITTATDVYALGLLLCELLTGQLPHGRRDSPSGVAQAVADDATQRPSQLGENSGSGRIDAELDTIVLKALALEPERRYPSAAALAEDLQRYREGRPIRAKPDTFSYRLAKFVRRHRGGVATGVFALMSLLGGLGVALWQAHVAREQAQIAQAQTQRAERVKAFLTSLFAETEGNTRQTASARTPLQMVSSGIERAQIELAQDPALLDSVLGDLLDIKVNLGGAAEALPLLEERIAWRQQRDPLDESLAVALSSKITVLFQKGAFADAEPLIAQAIQIYRAHHPEDHLRIADMQNRQVRVLLSRTQYPEALALMREVVAKFEKGRGKDHPDVGLRLSNLATLQQRTGDVEGARASLERSLAILERARGVDHAQLAFPLTNLGDLLRNQGRFGEALGHYERVLAISRKQHGDAHFNTAEALGRVGDMQRRLRQFDAAKASLSKSLAILEAERNNSLADVYGRLGQLAVAQNQPEEAAQWFQKAYDFASATQGERHILTWHHLSALALVRAHQGRYAEAREGQRRAIGGLVALGDAGAKDAALSRFELGAIERDAGNLDLAVDLMLDADAEARSLLSESDPRLTILSAHLATALALRGTPADADTARQLLIDIQDALTTAQPETKALAALARARLAVDAASRSSALADLDAALALLGSDGTWLRSQRAKFD